MTLLQEYLQSLGLNVSAAQCQDFISWATMHIFDEYRDYKMKIQKLAQQELDSASISIPNVTKGEPMVPQTFTLPASLTRDFDITGLDDTGLACERDAASGAYTISGTPAREGQVDFTITCDYEGRLPDEPLLTRTVGFYVNPDPRSLWKDIPTPEHLLFPKPDLALDSIIVPREAAFPEDRAKDVAAASRRGRSHANEGRPRDDDFAIKHLDNGWFVLAVCDGAGSAAYSRKGAAVAAETVKDYCVRALGDNPNFEAMARDYVARTLAPAAVAADAPAPSEAPAGDAAESADAPTDTRVLHTASLTDNARRAAYDILAQAAFAAHKEVAKTAEINGFTMRDFATTLLLTIAKRYEAGWFVASFWIGDGAIALYDAPTATVRVMGTPDEGEFAGQTRFLTMTDIFRDSAGLFRRVRVDAIPDFTLLALMSDGVSDPMFETDARLESPQAWEEFRQKLIDGFPADGIKGVDLSDDVPATAHQLLDWLNFWSRGNHDDRTLVILY